MPGVQHPPAVEHHDAAVRQDIGAVVKGRWRTTGSSVGSDGALAFCRDRLGYKCPSNTNP